MNTNPTSGSQENVDIDDDDLDENLHQNEECSNEKDDIIEMPALGRPFRLGMLYDRNKDCILPGEIMFPYNLVKEHTLMEDAHGMNTVMMLGDSHEEKSGYFNNDKSLQVSIMFGIGLAGCSGKHLVEPKTSTDKLKASVGVNLYKEYGEIDVRELYSRTEKHVFQRKTNATHIVSAIKYGGHTEFEFQKTIGKEESQIDAKAEMKKAISLIGIHSVSTTDDSKNKIDMKSTHESISCKYFGDTILPTIPTNYEESVWYIKEISSHLGRQCAPVTVWLYPLSRLNPHMSHVNKMLENLESSEILQLNDDLKELRANTQLMMESPACIFIPDVLSKLRSVDKELQRTEQELKEFVIERRRDNEHSKKKFDANPINKRKQWMNNATEEMKILNYYVNELRKNDLTPSDGADLEAKIFESDRLVHLMVSLPFLRDQLTHDDKRIMGTTLLNAERRQTRNRSVTEATFDESTWIRNSQFKSLFRKCMLKIINLKTSSSKCAVTFSDTKSSPAVVNCFHVEVYASGEVHKDSTFNFWS